MTPAMRPNWRSSGVATADAIVSGLAPGRFADAEIVGKSTCGSADTARNQYATQPASARANVSNVVATGLWMNGLEIFTGNLLSPMFAGAHRVFQIRYLIGANDVWNEPPSAEHAA
jgi:hypothetical protein